MLAAVKLTSWPALSIAAVTACGRIDFGAHGDGGAAEGSADCSVPSGVTTGLVGWWKFDEASGAVAIDAAAGNDGLLLSGSSRVAGHLGGAVAFDGVTGRVDIGGTVPYATHAAAFSFSAWVNLADWSTGTPDIMQIRTDGTSSPFHVLFSNNANWDGVSTGDGDGSWIPLRTDVEPSLGAWHHVAVVYNGDGARMVANFRFSSMAWSSRSRRRVRMGRRPTRAGSAPRRIHVTSGRASSTMCGSTIARCRPARSARCTR